jgi:hypothetical protein
MGGGPALRGRLVRASLSGAGSWSTPSQRAEGGGFVGPLLARQRISQILCETEVIKPNRLRQSLRERDHRAHVVAHSLAALLLATKASLGQWLDLASAVEQVSPGAALLLRQHCDDAFQPGSVSDDHDAHALTDGAMLLTHEREPGWEEEKVKGTGEGWH